MDGMIISGGLVVGVIIVVLVLIILASCINIVPQANAYIIERLGAYIGTWSVGIHFKVPFLDRVAIIFSITIRFSSIQSFCAAALTIEYSPLTL